MDSVDASEQVANQIEVSLKFSPKLAFRVYEDFSEDEISLGEDGSYYVKTVSYLITKVCILISYLI